MRKYAIYICEMCIKFLNVHTDELENMTGVHMETISSKRRVSAKSVILDFTWAGKQKLQVNRVLVVFTTLTRLRQSVSNALAWVTVLEKAYLEEDLFHQVMEGSGL